VVKRLRNADFALRIEKGIEKAPNGKPMPTRQLRLAVQRF
jgi:hypothetical protein